MLSLTLIVAALLPIFALGAPQFSITTTVAVGATGVTASTSAPATFASTSSAETSTSTAVSAFPDNGACSQLHGTCVGQDGPEFRSVFNKLSCVAAVVCSAQDSTLSVDETIQDLYVATNGQGATPIPTSMDEPAFSINIFNQHSSDGNVWTQQNFIDVYYGALGMTNGPWPASADFAIASWSTVAAWTGFCDTKEIPYQNLADWFKYSSTVAGPATSC